MYPERPMLWSYPRQSQEGAALLVSLIMLLLMTLIGVSAMKVTLLESKMAGNVQAEIQAFNRAESSLREGEDFIRDTVVANAPYPFDDNPGVYDASSAPVTLNWDGTWNGISQSSDSGRQIIEYLGSENHEGESVALGTGTGTTGTTIYLFRVTSRGDNDSAQTTKVVRSVFATLDPP